MFGNCQMAELQTQGAQWASRLRLTLLGGLLVLLAGCSGSGLFAPVSDLSDRGVGGTYRVQPGDTLTSISRDTGVSVDRLASLNGITNPSMIRVGQQLRLGTDAPIASQSMSRDSMGGDSMGAQSTQRAQATVVSAGASEPAQAVRAADADRLSLVWPTKGKIIQRFTPQTKGIDIEGQVGQPVNAAADGKVVYSGDGVRGLGKLLILDHGGGFITAYAHNDTLLLKTGDSAKRGTQIATLGQTDTTSPRLHFEVRRQGTPVDPMRYLPKEQ
jgi:lipoprotein NlpD